MEPVNVRAVYRAARVAGETAPYDSITLKVYYPCSYGDSFEERNTGLIPADKSRAPFPVVIILPGVNVSHESYGWLAEKLAEAGFAAVTYSWVAQEMEDRVGVTPGVNLKRLARKRYGKKPSCPALEAILTELKRMNKKGVLEKMLNLESVVLGGHSAGGTMALLNANADWFPGVRGAFSYAAHTAASTQLGWDEDSIMPLARDLPLLIMGGTRDGVIAASSHRYGDESDSTPTERVERTFREGVKSKRGGRHLVLVEGANHFSFVWPKSDATGRPFLDMETTGSNREIRKYLAQVIVTFCDQACSGNPMTTADLQALCDESHPLVALAEHK